MTGFYQRGSRIALAAPRSTTDNLSVGHSDFGLQIRLVIRPSSFVIPPPSCSNTAMIHKSLNSIPNDPVAMPGAEKVHMQLLCGPADCCPNFAMRRFTVAPGGCTPKHQHDYEHEVLILAGEGMVFGDGREQSLRTGDVLYVPANELHQFRNTGGVALEFICMVPAFVHKAGAPGAAPKAVDCAK
jgi:quercetin dioxygenase-like cupin family protein